MITVKADFVDRVREINTYFSFMENIMLKDANLIYPDGMNEILTSDLKKILKANSFLILYNLSESCIKNAIEEIYSTLNHRRISYDGLRASIQKEVILFLKKHVNAKTFVDVVNTVAQDIILNCFDAKKLLSGNLDARKVKDLAGKYGFSYSIVPMRNPDGTLSNVESDKLLTVKKNRNDLAHGIYSFKDCGKDYTIQELLKIKTHVIEYLRQILDNIEVYLSNNEYLSIVT